MAKKHVHKYHKILLYGTKVWACALPECSHYMPDHLKNMMPGKASICWNCGEQLILDPINMQMDEPICNECMLIKTMVSDNNMELRHADDINKEHKIEPITKDKLFDLFKE